MPHYAKSSNKANIDLLSLRQWFLSHKRDLPWRNQPSPYAVWVSEVMLQQTQVSVVIPYFERWLNLFPDIPTLAKASLDQVIKAWEGLGYYSRARHLHEAANYLVKNYQGKLPDNAQDLKKIKGLGPYTIGAILSFAYHQKMPAVDGNVMRVLTRYFHIEDDISRPKTIANLRELALTLLPDEEHWIINEALIELGATICKKKPSCGLCPLRNSCQAFAQEKQLLLPHKSQKVQIEKLNRLVPVLACEGFLLVNRGEKGKVMSDLYQFPFFESNELPAGMCDEWVQQNWGLRVCSSERLQQVEHGFTRFKATLSPVLMAVEEMTRIIGYEWIRIEILKDLAFAAGHRQIFMAVCEKLIFEDSAFHSQ